ncbi:unnamed protein product [Cylicostephanus goldi]|uniref:Uncharacterized protein n=1 Tax=Cylicostephanus goldi TaxID=71465 RepID=A0A3P6RCD1_CYLGO|nr:unnamed protein product [Cylicostephanus goldi]
MIENSVADLLSRWDSAKTYLLDAEKRKTDSSSSRESLSMSAAFSEISAVIYDALHDETPGLLDFMPFRVPSLDDARVPPSESSRFDGIYDWGGESETIRLKFEYIYVQLVTTRFQLDTCIFGLLSIRQ